MASIYNNTPATYSLGVDDQSTRSVPLTDEQLAQKIDLYYIFARKGGSDRFLGNIADANLKYGSDTFNPLSKYFTHQTDLLSETLGVGGQCVMHRIIPDDAGVRANISLYLDVLETYVPNYKRTSDGSYYLVDGKKQLDADKPYIPGRYIKWYKKSEATEIDFGSLKVNVEGSMAKWNLIKEDEVHLLASDTNIEADENGHVAYADKTVYTYKTKDDMYAPNASTTRLKYTVDAQGRRTKEGEDTFDGDKILKSKVYPIFQVKAKHQGEWYNLFGFNITSMANREVPATIVKELKTLPYKFGYKVKDDVKSAPKPYKTLSGDLTALFTFKNNSVDPVTGMNLSLEFITDNLYFNEHDINRSLNFEEIEKVYFYRDNFEAILKGVIEDEIPFVTLTEKQWADGQEGSTFNWYDFTTYKAELLPEEFGLLNPFTTATTKACPYFTLQYNNEVPTTKLQDYQEINMVNGNPIFLERGSDGTLSMENFEAKIKEDLENYLDDNHEYLDQARHVETFFWDTGFSLEIKKKIPNMIAKKHNTIIGLCTHYDSLGDESLSLQEQSALGKALYNDVRLRAESLEFGTPTIRAIIALGTFTKRDSKKRLPVLRDIAIKTTKLMGGSDKQWRSNNLFDSGEKTVIEDYIDIQPNFIPPSVKDSLVDNGITYVQNFGRKSYFLPGTRTVYSDKTSIAGSFVNMLALPYCERVAFEVWRELTGTVSLTSAQFIHEVKNRASRKLAGAFGGVIQPTVEATITQEDENLGYVWRLNISLYGNNAKYKQIYNTTLKRTVLETK